MEAYQKPTLGYWKIRGLAANVRYQLKYCGVDYDMVEYTQGPGPDFSRQEWLDKKFNLGLPFPNLPYLIHGDVKLTETLAIHKYLAEVYDQSLLGRNAIDKARVTMFAQVLVGLKGKITMPCYTTGEKNTIIEEYKKGLPAILEAKGSNIFLIGDYPTYVDFYFFEMLQLMKFVSEGAILKEFPDLDSYEIRMKGLKGLKEYISTPTCHDANLNFNNTVAKINGQLGYN